MNLTEHDEKYGKKGLSRRLGSGYYNSVLLSSGVFGLDLAHGIGGIKTGSVVQLMGPPGLGKSSIAYRMVANGMKAGMSAFIIDTEGGFNEAILMDTLEDYGIDVNDPNLPFRYSLATSLRGLKRDKTGSFLQSDSKPVLTIERAVPMIEDWIISEEISPKGAIVVIDSLDFMLSDSMVGSKVDDMTVAIIARRMKLWLKTFIGTIRATGSMLIFVHQVSSKIDPHAKDTETFTGGNALRHAAHFALRLKDIGQELVGDEVVGRNVKAIITKSKQGLAWRTFSYTIRYDCGPDNIGAVFEAAVKLKIIKKSGAWFTLPDMPEAFQGKDSVRQFWLANPTSLRYTESLVLGEASAHAAELTPEAGADERLDDEIE